MMLGKKFFTNLVLFTSYLLSIGCHADMTDSVHEKNETVYFASFTGYSIPLKLTEKISKDDAISRRSYYLASYDGNGLLRKVEKYLDGELFFSHTYSYHPSGVIKKSIVINAEGDEKANYFDQNGKPMR